MCHFGLFQHFFEVAEGWEHNKPRAKGLGTHQTQSQRAGNTATQGQIAESIPNPGPKGWVKRSPRVLKFLSLSLKLKKFEATPFS